MVRVFRRRYMEVVLIGQNLLPMAYLVLNMLSVLRIMELYPLLIWAVI